MNARGKSTISQKKIRLIVIACFAAACLLVELLGYIPGLAFNGWNDLFSWIGLPQPTTIAEDELQVHFIDVGNADCILIRQADHNMLIDTGEYPREQRVLDYLDRHGVEKLDLVISTHPHVDHMGMMESIIYHIPIERFVMSYMPEGKEPTHAPYEAMMDALDAFDVPITEAKPGDVYALGDAEVQILAPYSLEVEDANQISVVTRLTFGNHAFLFTGDAEADLEERMVASGFDLSADVLKVAHHGSKTSTSPAFLRAVSPQYAVITCGFNDYGHPHEETITRLTAARVQIYRADVYGDIVFSSDGKELTITTEKGQKDGLFATAVTMNNRMIQKENRRKHGGSLFACVYNIIT